MTANERNYHKSKHPTLCWDCEWAGGKDKKCPWASNFEPVPGWKAEQTKIMCMEHKNGYIESFDVYECPLFELVDAIKKGIVSKARECKPIRNKKIFKDKETIENIKNLRKKGLAIPEIACEVGYSVKTIQRTLNIIKESEQNGKEI